MERPPQRYFCHKCWYVGSSDTHPGCNYFAYPMAHLEQIYIDHLEAELAALRASPASAPVAAPDYRIADRGFRWDAENRQHIPQLLIEFTPVPENEPNDLKGWKDRDKLAAMLAAAPPPPSTEDRNKLELYGELLYAVANKFPGESRHQTALRYIRNAEKGSDNATQQEDKKL